MNDSKTNFTARLTRRLLELLFLAGALITVSVPWTLRFIAPYYPSIEKHYWFHTVLFLLSGAGSLVILFELRRMFCTVLAENCFVRENVVCLRRMAYVAFGIALLFAVRVFVVFTPASVLIVGVFFLAGLFSLTLSRVFDRAVRYKEENDLTI